MTDWSRVLEDLAEAGSPRFEFDSGDTAIPSLSGEWVVGRVPRDSFAFENEDPDDGPVATLVGLFPVTSTPTDPALAPDPVRRVAAAHDLDVVVVSGDDEAVWTALCDPETRAPHDRPH